MSFKKQRQRAHERDPQRNLQLAHQLKSFAGKDTSLGLLLAEGCGRCRRNHENMRQTHGETTARPGFVLAADSTNLDILAVGHRHNWPNASSSRQPSLCSSGNRIVVQVDQSKSTPFHHFCHNLKIILAEHRLPLWCAKIPYC